MPVCFLAAQVDIGVLPFPRADGREAAGEARSNQRFLEDMVRRLSEELARLQGSDQPSADARSVAGATPAAFLEVPWMRSPLPSPFLSLPSAPLSSLHCHP